MDPEKCKECGSKELDYIDNCILVCTNCGLENEKIINNTAEWRVSDKSRCMIGNILIPNAVLTTGVKGNSKYNRFSNTMKYSDRKIITIDSELNSLSEKYNIPSNIISQSLSLFIKVSNTVKSGNKKIIKRGKNLEGIKAACMYIAYVSQKKSGIFKTQDEIAQMFNIPIHFLHSNLPIGQSILNIKFEEYSDYNDFINSCFNKYNSNYNVPITQSQKDIAIKTINQIQNNPKLQNFMNKSVVCGLFYYILKDQSNCNIKNMAKVWGISHITIKKVEKVISELINS